MVMSGSAQFSRLFLQIIVCKNAEDCSLPPWYLESNMATMRDYNYIKMGDRPDHHNIAQNYILPISLYKDNEPLMYIFSCVYTVACQGGGVSIKPVIRTPTRHSLGPFSPLID